MTNLSSRKPVISKSSSETKQLIKKIRLSVSEQELNQLAAFYKNIIYQGVLPQDNYFLGKNIITRTQGQSEWKLLFNNCRLSKGNKILNVGCGFGLLERWGLEHGYQCYGVEPDPIAVAIASKLLSLNGYRRPSRYIFQGCGEKLHFKKNYFDAVVSLSVMEHVSQPKLVINEMLRVLKPGGLLVIICPNYASFWEMHYSLPWFPFFSKKMAKLYVRLLGRRADLIDELNFIKPSFLKNYFKTKRIEFKDQGEKATLLIIQAKSNINHPFLKKITKEMRPTLLKLISWLHTYPYIKFVATKNLSNE